VLPLVLCVCSYFTIGGSLTGGFNGVDGNRVQDRSKYRQYQFCG
jgi:hypothetical protein